VRDDQFEIGPQYRTLWYELSVTTTR
jgi:hypothetical protein